jgi:hypothetical protein
MKKPHEIIQTNFSISSESLDNYMVLVFTKNNEVVSTHTIAFPQWWKFYDENYPYHPFSYN